jgi:hypothetical protein
MRARGPEVKEPRYPRPQLFVKSRDGPASAALCLRAICLSALTTERSLPVSAIDPRAPRKFAPIGYG